MSKQKENKNKETEQEIEQNVTEQEQTAAQPEEEVASSENPLEQKCADLEEQINQWEDKYRRLYAEFDNYQKRTAKEKDARYTDALIDTVAEFLQVADNLDRAIATEVESEEAKKILEGVVLVKKQMSDTLTKLKVAEIKALGEEFDPNLHNAVMHIEDESVTDNTVVEEFLKGYIYNNEKVVRHSMVKVAN